MHLAFMNENLLYKTSIQDVALHHKKKSKKVFTMWYFLVPEAGC